MMLTSLRDLSNSINLPEDFIRRISIHPEKANSIITTALFNQYREDSSYLIDILEKELKNASFGLLSLVFEEIATINGLNRNIFLKGKVDKSYNTELSEFKRNFFKTMSSTAEFIAIKQSKVWKVIMGRSIGDIFQSPPKLYDINANPIDLPSKNKKPTILLIWNKEEHLTQFITNLTLQAELPLSKLNIITISTIKDNFFSRKEFILRNSSIENITHYFEGDSFNTFFTYGNDPSIMIIDPEGIIKYDKSWYGENISMIYNKTIQGETFPCYEESDIPYINANEWWWNTDNCTKNNYIEMIHEKLNEMDLPNIYFTMSSKVIIDNKKDIIKIVHPILSGAIELEYKDYLDQFQTSLKEHGRLDHIDLNITYTN